MSLTNTICENLTKIFTLDKVGYSIKADFSTVSVLKTNEIAIEDINTKKIANLEKIATLDPTIQNKVNLELYKIF